MTRSRTLRLAMAAVLALVVSACALDAIVSDIIFSIPFEDAATAEDLYSAYETVQIVGGMLLYGTP